MIVIGWNKDDVKCFNDLLVKANMINLRAMQLSVDSEIEARESIIHLQEIFKNLE